MSFNNGLPSDPSTANNPELTARLRRLDDFYINPYGERLSIPFPARLPLSTTIAFLTGSSLGLYHGSSEAGLRFRAENAHRFPTTQTGWYLYHKSKNYHVALGGVKEGLKMGLRMGVWVGVFVGMEEFIDKGRAGAVAAVRRVGGRGEGDFRWLVSGNRDFVSSTLAGLGTAGAFSAWSRMPVPTAARLARMGAKVGFAYGVVQDLVGWLRGRRLGYVEFVKRHTVGGSEEEASAEKADVAAAAG